MKQRRRSRLETMNVILKLSTNGCKKTHIMYQANLSHSQLIKYLRILEQRQLIKEAIQSYVTTKIGREFIKKFQEIQELMSETHVNSPDLFSR